MQSIALPTNIEFKKGENKNQEIITVDPCYPGYGITLGNALRRVLLSSLPGAAVVGVKIKGAGHEFTAIPHIKEDILEIILNLKKLNLKVHSDEMVKLILDVHGEKTVSAGDIEKNSQIEIINKDLVIANITDMAGSLYMEIFIDHGRGYEIIEARERKQKEIDYIEIDSIFTPVLAVGIQVENVRVGKMTNWDKLILNITTDGTITPKESFNKAIRILVDQFKALLGEKKEKKSGEKSKAEVIDDIKSKIIKKEEVQDDDIKIGDDIKEDKEEGLKIKEQTKKKRGRPKKVT